MLKRLLMLHWCNPSRPARAPGQGQHLRAAILQEASLKLVAGQGPIKEELMPSNRVLRHIASKGPCPEVHDENYMSF